jgi:asparagine synthase (glutamine-hydrolysing)
LVGLPPETFRTRFRDISCVAAGHLLRTQGRSLSQERYWRYESLKPIHYRKDSDYIDDFREIFEEAVNCSLRSVGGVATELSGGLDSGSVTATAARLLAAQGGRLTAFTAVPQASFEFAPERYRGRVADEGAFASDVARMYATVDHIKVDSSSSNLLRELERNFVHLEIPCAGGLNSVWGNLILDQTAHAGARVLLTGGLGNFAMSYTGDELCRLFYNRGQLHKAMKTAWHLRRRGHTSVRAIASQTVLTSLPWSLQRKLDPLIRGTSISETAIRADKAREWKSLEQFIEYVYRRSTMLPKCLETFFHHNQYGAYNLAAQTGWGVDVRDPTADRRVYEFCVRIPQEQFVVGGQTRSLIRRAMHGQLPKATLLRQELGIQSADWYECITPIRTEILAELVEVAKSPLAASLIDIGRLERALNSWPVASKVDNTHNGLHNFALTRGLACAYFIRKTEQCYAEHSTKSH